MAEQKQESVDEMMTRVAGEMKRRSGMLPAGSAKAAKWGKFAAAVARGQMPHDPFDPELSLTYGQEIARASAAGRIIPVEELPASA
jgi:hypothetical protein